jgi:hypothetical protein
LGKEFNLVVTPIHPPLGDIKVLSRTTLHVDMIEYLHSIHHKPITMIQKYNFLKGQLEYRAPISKQRIHEGPSIQVYYTRLVSFQFQNKEVYRLWRIDRQWWQ